MGLKKTHEHESGFFEENILTTAASEPNNRNRYKLNAVADEKMRSPQQIRESSRGPANMIDNCNNVSVNYEKLINTLSTFNNHENTQTIVIDSDEDDDDDDDRNNIGGSGGCIGGDNRYADKVIVTTVTNGHCSSNPDPDVVDVADDSDDIDDTDEMLESMHVRIGDNQIDDDSADEDVDIDGSSNTIQHQQQQQQSHHPQLQHHQHISQQSKSSNTSSNNNRVQEKSKNGDTDAKSSIQLMQEIEEASTIRPQGEFN